MGIASIPSRIRSLQRLPQIISILAKYGFGDIVSRTGADSAFHQLKTKIFDDVDHAFATLRTEERIRRALEELGPTFVKMGQVMATRPDLIPLALCEELRLLQDKVEPFDTEGVGSLVEKELGQPVDTLFKTFDPKPLAAASIAQVHRATLKDGRDVILKIQRPNLDRIIETDLAILGWMAQVAAEQVPELRRYDPEGLVAEFKKSITKEIDFEIEAYHIRRFAKCFEGDDSIYVPEVIGEYCTTRILCEEFIPGIPLNDKRIYDGDVDLKQVARTGIRCIVQQALVHGFFHGDPHPGNIFVLPGNKVCFIDYGMMGILDQERIDELLSFLVAILTRDLDKLVNLFYRLELITEDVNVRALRNDIDDLIARFESIELAKLDVGKFLQSCFEVISSHNVLVPSDLLLIGKALATIEGVGREIYPELNALEEIRPIILKIYINRLTDPTYHTRVPRRVVRDLGYLLETGPRDLRVALRKLRTGELTHKLELGDYHKSVRSQAQATNRLALAILTSALVLSSAYIFTHASLVPWVSADFPLNAVLGVVGLSLAVIYGGILTIGFLRSGAF